MGGDDEKASFELLDYFYQNGGNFIDTGSAYQHEESEMILGKWMKERGNRDEMVIATKYTGAWQAYQGRKRIQPDFGGMNAKSLRHSLEASLEKFGTSFVDIFYVHWWDYSTEVRMSMPVVLQPRFDRKTDPRAHASSQRCSAARESVVPRNLGYTSVDCGQSERVCARPQSATFCGLPGQVERCSSGFREENPPNVSGRRDGHRSLGSGWRGRLQNGMAAAST
jgi:Aldo/keto reductase family